MDFVAEDIVKLVFAIVIGSVIGAEREYRDKAAGFRTLVFICLGATLFTLLSLKIARNSDPARIAAQIVTGVGFLGAGAILRDRGRVVGMTTAAMIWLSAALGMSIGSGNYILSAVVAGIVMVVLWIFPYLEEWIDSRIGTEHYEVVCPHKPGKYEALLSEAQAAHLMVISSKCSRVNENIIVTMVLRGTPGNQAAWSLQMINDTGIKEFRH